MWTPVIWYMLISVCSADPAVGCMETVVEGFVSERSCEDAASGPVSEALRHVKPHDVPVAVTVTCVGIETREA